MTDLCPICRLDYDCWPRCYRGDCHDGRWPPLGHRLPVSQVQPTTSIKGKAYAVFTIEPYTLMWKPEGPKLGFDGDTLHIYDLNPELHIKWKFSKREMIKFIWACIKSVVIT